MQASPTEGTAVRHYLPGEKGCQHPLTALADPSEAYGAHIVASFIARIGMTNVLDIGAGSGRDLRLIAKAHPSAKRIAIDTAPQAPLLEIADEVHHVDIERQPLPFPDEHLDFIIANQVLEHTKEIFWIFHEISRCLAPGGRLLIGVPNVAAFHNRLMMLAGYHPTQHRLYSAHVRPFSKNDTLAFLEACFPGGYKLERFAGAQIYPFPTPVARALCRAFPTAGVSIFFLFQKQGRYVDGFRTYPARAHLETNFFAG